MRVLLLYPPIWHVTGWRTNCNNGIGLLSIGAVLRAREHTVRIIDAEVYGFTIEQVIEEVRKWSPTHVGISCLTNGLETAINLTKIIKEKFPNIWVALGGAGPSAEPEFALKESGADSVTVGEAELVLDKSFGDKGIHIGIPPKDLDELPDPAYDLLEPTVGSTYWAGNLPHPDLENIREIMVMWSRGCPHPCTFCSKASMKRGYPRMRNPVRIRNELKMLRDKFGINSVFVYDDELIGLGLKHNEWLLDVLRCIWFWNSAENTEPGIWRETSKPKIVLKGQGRCNKEFITEQVALELKHSGFFAMMMGCESGSEIVKKHVKKMTSNDDIRHTLKILHESGIKVFGFWMVGMPEETPEEAKKTERLILEMAPYMTWIQVSVFSPLMGSDFWDEAVENGWLKDFNRIKNFQTSPMLDMPWMTGDQILKMQKRFYEAFWWAKCQKNSG